MNKTALLAALPLALTLGACGEPIDGSDTADLGNDPTTAPAADAPDDGPLDYEPGEDGLLQSDMEPMGDDDAADEPAMDADAAL